MASSADMTDEQREQQKEQWTRQHLHEVLHSTSSRYVLDDHQRHQRALESDGEYPLGFSRPRQDADLPNAYIVELDTRSITRGRWFVTRDPLRRELFGQHVSHPFYNEAHSQENVPEERAIHLRSAWGAECRRFHSATTRRPFELRRIHGWDKLSAELRNYVYDLLAPHYRLGLSQTPTTLEEFDGSGRSPRLDALFPPVLRVSQGMRREFWGVYYQAFTMNINNNDQYWGLMRRTLSRYVYLLFHTPAMKFVSGFCFHGHFNDVTFDFKGERVEIKVRWATNDRIYIHYEDSLVPVKNLMPTWDSVFKFVSTLVDQAELSDTIKLEGRGEQSSSQSDEESHASPDGCSVLIIKIMVPARSYDRIAMFSSRLLAVFSSSWQRGDLADRQNLDFDRDAPPAEYPCSRCMEKGKFCRFSRDLFDGRCIRCREDNKQCDGRSGVCPRNRGDTGLYGSLRGPSTGSAGLGILQVGNKIEDQGMGAEDVEEDN